MFLAEKFGRNAGISMFFPMRPLFLLFYPF